MAKTASTKTKLEREKEKAAKAEQKAQIAAEKEKVKQQKEAEKAAAAATKAAKAAERARVEAEREKLRKEKEEMRMERERLQVEKEKERLAREKEKSEREREKNEKDKVRKEKQQEQERLVDRSRNLLSAFLGVTQKTATTDNQTQAAPTTSAAAAPQTSSAPASTDSNGGSTDVLSHSAPASSPSSSSSTCATASPPAAPQPLFHPFQLKPNSTLAPLHRLPPATIDEIDLMTQQQSPHATFSDYLSLASLTSHSSTASLRTAYTCSSDAVIVRRKRKHSAFHSRPSRRTKLIQHHRTFRPPYYGWLGSVPSRPLSPTRPFAAQSSGVNYEVDSDEEWGEEPEGEELGEDEEEADDDPDGTAKEGGGRGRLRRDGYEEDGDFTVPEEEDEALLMSGLMADARVVEKGGKKRVVIRPIVVGPWHAGDAVSAEVAELRRRTQWKWCRPLTREVVKRVKDVVDEKADKSDTPKPQHKRKTHTASADTTAANSDRDGSGVVDERVDESSTSAVQQAVVQQVQQRVGDCFTPSVRKKVKRTIVPQLTSTLPPDTSTAAPLTSAPLPSPSLLSSTPVDSDKPEMVVEVVQQACVGNDSVSGVLAGDVVMQVVDADGGNSGSGSELDVSEELELTTELSCSEAGTCSDMMTSELSAAD